MKTRPKKNISHLLSVSAQQNNNSLSDTVGKVTMATILVLNYSTTSELSSNIWLLGTFLKYKLAVTI